MRNNSSLFTIDLKIDTKLLKLHVKSEDCLSDLISNLASSITWKKIPREKIKERLQEQFKKLISQGKVSGKVKNKLEELLEESKLVIVGIENQSNQIFDETPFRILQESTINGRKTHERMGKQYQYLNSNAYHLHNKYQLQQPKQHKSSTKTDSQFQKIIVKPNTPQKYNYCSQDQAENILEGEAIRKKYQEIDRKCQEYISRNLAHSQEMKECYDRYRHSQIQRHAEHGSNHQKKLFERNNSTIMTKKQKEKECQDRIFFGQDKRYGENKLLSTPNLLNTDAVSSNISDNYGAESFQAYKMNRIKSSNSIHCNSINPIAKRETIKTSVNLCNREVVEDSYSSNNKGMISNTHRLELKRDYSNTNSAYNLRRQGIYKKYQYDLEI